MGLSDVFKSLMSNDQFLYNLAEVGGGLGGKDSWQAGVGKNIQQQIKTKSYQQLMKDIINGDGKVTFGKSKISMTAPSTIFSGQESNVNIPGTPSQPGKPMSQVAQTMAGGGGKNYAISPSQLMGGGPVPTVMTGGPMMETEKNVQSPLAGAMGGQYAGIGPEDIMTILGLQMAQKKLDLEERDVSTREREQQTSVPTKDAQAEYTKSLTKRMDRYVPIKIGDTEFQATGEEAIAFAQLEDSSKTMYQKMYEGLTDEQKANAGIESPLDMYNAMRDIPVDLQEYYLYVEQMKKAGKPVDDIQTYKSKYINEQVRAGLTLEQIGQRSTQSTLISNEGYVTSKNFISDIEDEFKDNIMLDVEVLENAEKSLNEMVGESVPGWADSREDALNKFENMFKSKRKAEAIKDKLLLMGLTSTSEIIGNNYHFKVYLPNMKKVHEFDVPSWFPPSNEGMEDFVTY